MHQREETRHLEAKVLEPPVYLARAVCHNVGLNTQMRNQSGSLTSDQHTKHTMVYDQYGRVSVVQSDIRELDDEQKMAVYRAAVEFVLTRVRAQIAVGDGSYVQPMAATNIDEVVRQVMRYDSDSPPFEKATEAPANFDTVAELPGTQLV